jgi:hypothetical protein
MPATLRTADLHEDYRGASPEEAILMANLGAVSYRAVKKELYEQWSASMEGDESAKAEIWRSEGRQLMLESVRSKIVAAEEMSARLAAAEGTIQQLRASTEAEVGRRLAEALDGHRKDIELSKMAEISGLKERLAMLEGKGELFQMVSESQVFMKEKITALETQLALQTVANTKSSHAIGKAGEATVLEILNVHVIPSLPYASVKDMTSVGHAADFHLTAMLETGSKAKILIDAKKYKRRVNTNEIEKLFTDVDDDEEANAGIMISLESHIFTMKQFQIARTPKQKPVLFVSFCDISEEMRKDLTTWAVRILIDILSQKTSDDKDSMVANLNVFLSEMDEVVKELETGLRSLIKSVESIKNTRDGLIRRIVNFRAGKPVETPIETAMIEGCAYIAKTGTKCGRKLISGTTFCRSHVKKSTDVIALED